MVQVEVKLSMLCQGFPMHHMSQQSSHEWWNEELPHMLWTGQVQWTLRCKNSLRLFIFTLSSLYVYMDRYTTCVHMCECSCVCIPVPTYHRIYVEVRGQPQLSVLAFSLFWHTSFVYFIARLTGPWPSRNSASIFHLTIGVLGLQICVTTPSFTLVLGI